MLVEDRALMVAVLPVGVSVSVCPYVAIYTVRFAGVAAGTLVHLTGLASVSNDLAYNVGLGVVLLRVHASGTVAAVLPYAMANLTPADHHAVRPFGVYDVTPQDDPKYVLKLYAVATRAGPGDALTIHRNGYLQGVAL